MKKIILVSFILFCSNILLFQSPGFEEPKILVSGGWFRSINQFDLKAGAGSDLKENYESPLDETIIDIIAPNQTSWKVYVRRINHSNKLSIYIRRTSEGRGKGSIEGGENFIPVEENPKPLFWGKGEKRGITVQFRISGVSINIPPGLKGFRILYEVKEEP